MTNRSDGPARLGSGETGAPRVTIRLTNGAVAIARHVEELPHGVRCEIHAFGTEWRRKMYTWKSVAEVDYGPVPPTNAILGPLDPPEVTDGSD